MLLNNRKKHTEKWLVLIGVTFLVIALFVVIIPQILRVSWAGKIYPNVVVGNVELGGMTRAEAQTTLQKSWNSISQSGITLYLGEYDKMKVYPIVIAPEDPDLSYEVIEFDLNDALDRALSAGRDNDLKSWVFAPYISIFQTEFIPAKVNVNKKVLEEIIKENFSSSFIDARDAQFKIDKGDVLIVPEKSGMSIDIDYVASQIENKLSLFDASSLVELKQISVKPSVYVQDVRPLVGDAREILDRAPFVLNIDITDNSRQRFYLSLEVGTNQIQSWLGVKRMGDKKVHLSFNDSLKKYLEEISYKVNREPANAKFDIDDSGRLSRFQASKDGRALNIDESYEKMIRDLIVNKQSKSELVVDMVEPDITTEKANDLGIKEIIGVGTSDFSGSPRNRRINIQVASDKLNGILIAPGEEFSLVQSLKPFTVEEGYVPELVIKGSKLVPELGGGACQIGTTLFRSVLDAGLDITQRQNHSFAVSYYNDENGLPGTDATIYDPAPDFRFVNDTGNYILIQTNVGDDGILTYTLWGASDGRQASISTPEILASFPAPETKYVETEDLEAGVTECSGSNVPGYNTTFKYTVKYSDGKVHEESFNSRYKPFQRVCLIGVEKTDTGDPSRSSTNPPPVE